MFVFVFAAVPGGSGRYVPGIVAPLGGGSRFVLPPGFDAVFVLLFAAASSFLIFLRMNRHTGYSSSPTSKVTAVVGILDLFRIDTI